MAEQLVERYVGVHTADAEAIELAFVRGDLVVRYVNWKEEPCVATFVDVLAFRWQEFESDAPRDDTTYEVLGSEWLQRQAQLQAVEASAHAHYRLCFNACGMLDVLCRRFTADV